MGSFNKKQFILIKVRAYAFSFFAMNALAVFVNQGEMSNLFWILSALGFLFFSGLVLKYGLIK